MANSVSQSIPVVFVDEEYIEDSFSPVRKGLRSTRRSPFVGPLSDDRRSRYFEEVNLGNSSDDESHIICPSGAAVLSHTPISSHDVFSFQKPKRKSALADAASEACHVNWPELQNMTCNQRKLVGEESRDENASDSSNPDSDLDDKDKTKDIAKAMNNMNDMNNNLEDMLDEYFLSHDDENCLTSDRTLSSLSTPRMDQETLSAVLKSRVRDHGNERAKLYEEYRTHFPKWTFQLRNGFNILLHGLGSKRHVIDQFRSSMFSNFVQLVVNGFFPSITIKSILNTITTEVLGHDGTFKNLIEQCNFIKNYYEENDEELYLTIHNIDGAMLRPSSTQTILSLLAQCPSIYLVASIDHIHAPLIWDQTQVGRFNWLWYDVTTFEPYSEETSYENSLLIQQSGSLAFSSLIHVFRSLTANAKGIFLLIGNYQIDHSKEAKYAGMSFHDCYTKCREAFLVNSDATLRAQLTEFRDHKLIRSKKGVDGVEYLRIPLDDSVLKQFIEDQD